MYGTAAEARDRRARLTNVVSRARPCLEVSRCCASVPSRRVSTEVKIMVEMLINILAEEEDDDLLLLYYENREPIDPIFKSRNEEGYYQILIQKHLYCDEKKFRKFCRLNKKQFNFVLSLIMKEIQPKTCKKSISPEEKLFLTLR